MHKRAAHQCVVVVRQRSMSGRQRQRRAVSYGTDALASRARARRRLRSSSVRRCTATLLRLERAAGGASAALRLYAVLGPPAERRTVMFLAWKRSALVSS
eukprot:1110150-Alexandrium_andersonii.AAC.1